MRAVNICHSLMKISKEKLMERKIKINRSTQSGFENYVTKK